MSGTEGRSSAAPAEAPARFAARYWQTDKGLPHNSVYAVCQAADGQLWVATDGGLVCFDGYRFKPTPVDALLGDAHDLVRHLALDRRGALWLATADGRVARAGPEGFRWLTPPGTTLGQPVAAMDEGADGSFWFGLAGSRLVRIKDGVIESNLAPTSLVAPGGTQLAVDRRDGRVWFSSGRSWGCLENGRFHLQAPVTETNVPVRLLAARGGGLWRITDGRLFRSGERDEWRDLGPLPDRIKQIKRCFEDAHGRFWCATAGEALHYFQDGRWERVLGLPHAVLTLAEDNEGHLWVGTDGSGLARFRPKSFRLINPVGGSSRQPVRSVCEDRDGAIWWTSAGRHLSRLHEGREHVFPTKDFLPTIRVLHAHPQTGVWLGTSSGVYHLRHQGGTNWTTERVINAGVVNALLVDRAGALWAGTTERVVRVAASKLRWFKDPPAGPGDAVQVLAEDAAGRVWAGTRKGTLHRFDGQQFVEYDTAAGLSGHRIQAILPNADGSLWLGTVGGGLVWFHDGRAARLTMARGLPMNAIAQIVSGASDDLWLGGSRGLFRAREADLRACVEGRVARLNPIAYGRNEGLPSLNAADWVQPSAWITRAGERLFATTGGLVGVDARRAAASAPLPPVRVEDVLANGRVWAAAERLALPADARQVTVRFTTPGFAQAELINFRHRLAGVDEGWIETGGLREARYTRLTPGAYRFEVQACHNDGVWQAPGAAFTLVIPPFLWETPWFTALGVVGLVGTGALALRQWSTRRLQQKFETLKRQQDVLKERERIARDIHDEIGAGLTNLSLLGELAQRGRPTPQDLRGELGRMTARARDMVRALDEIVWAVNPRNDTLDALIAYLCHYAQDTLQAAVVRCRLEAPEGAPVLPLTAEFRHHVFLLLKETLNNVCKHSGAAQVELSLRSAGGRLELSVRDDGRGFDPERAGAGRCGLANLRARAALLGGTFELSSRPGGPTTARFDCPLPASSSAIS